MTFITLPSGKRYSIAKELAELLTFKEDNISSLEKELEAAKAIILQDAELSGHFQMRAEAAEARILELEGYQLNFDNVVEQRNKAESELAKYRAVAQSEQTTVLDGWIARAAELESTHRLDVRILESRLVEVVALENECDAAQAQVAQLRRIVSQYADTANWTSGATIDFERPDGTDGQFDVDLGCACRWIGEHEEGHVIAREALSAAPERGPGVTVNSVGLVKINDTARIPLTFLEDADKRNYWHIAKSSGPVCGKTTSGMEWHLPDSSFLFLKINLCLDCWEIISEWYEYRGHAPDPYLEAEHEAAKKNIAFLKADRTTGCMCPSCKWIDKVAAVEAAKKGD